jgi:hypothetical protein
VLAGRAVLLTDLPVVVDRITKHNVSQNIASGVIREGVTKVPAMSVVRELHPTCIRLRS